MTPLTEYHWRRSRVRVRHEWDRKGDENIRQTSLELHSGIFRCAEIVIGLRTHILK